MIVRSEITGRTDVPGIDVAYISNMKQAQLYLRNGAKLIDILYYQTKNDNLIFLFSKS